jgi:hypothetical protein
MALTMYGEYVRALGDYARCLRGLQITPFAAGTNEYEGELTYTGPRLNAAHNVIVDHTVRIAPDPTSTALLFHEPTPGSAVIGNNRVQILFDIDPTQEPGPIPVKVTGVQNDPGGITFEVKRMDRVAFKPAL